MAEIRITQINLQHCKAASAVLTAAGGRFDVALIQEPWVRHGKIRGLGGDCGELIYSRSAEVPRTCIIIKKHIKSLPLTNFCSRDLTAVMIRTKEGNGARELVLGSAYFPSDHPEPPPTKDVEDLVRHCRNKGLQLIIGCDANAHHITWGSSDTNERGENLLQFLMSNSLDTLNVGNKPTFITKNRKEVLDVTIASTYVSNLVTEWHVSDEVSCSDHRHINFKIKSNIYKETYRNPRKTNWEAYRADLDRKLQGTLRTVRTNRDLELVVEELNDAAISTFNKHCPLIARNTTRKVPWWHKELAVLRKQARKEFNRAKKSGRWDEYKNALAIYKKALTKSKRDSWRRHCEEIEGSRECARLQKLLSKDTQQAIYSLKNERGEHTCTGEETIKELLRVHFPGAQIDQTRAMENPEELEVLKRGSRLGWNIAKKVVTYDKVQWAIGTFEPFKSPGPDGIYPAMLQKGPEVLHTRLCNIFRGSLALGHIPKPWRHVRVTFIPKPGKAGQDSAKSLRPISLMSFVLKTLEKLVDRHIRDGVLVERPLHREQYAYRTGCSTETALHRLVTRVENTLENKEVMLAAFLDIEGAFDNTSINSITRALRHRDIEEPCVAWIDSMLKNRLIHITVLEETIVARSTRGCPQGGVLSPLLWNLIADSLLETLNDAGHLALGYADDIVVLAQGKYNTTVRDRMQEALNLVTRWTDLEGLNVNPDKATIVAFTRRRKTEGLRPIRLRGEDIQIKGEVKYLGVILDSKLTWNQHLEKTTKKAVTSLVIARRSFGKKWGLKPHMLHWLYSTVVMPSITYASLVWWPKTQQRGAITRLGKVQRLACLGITGAIKSTSTAAMETLLGLPPLHLVVQGEARLGASRLKNTPNLNVGTGHMSIVRIVIGDALGARTDHIPKRYCFNNQFRVLIPDRTEWDNSQPKDILQGKIWYTDGSKTGNGAGSGVFSRNPSTGISYSLDTHTSVFQAEVYAILQCAKENNRRNVEGAHINILSDSQAALKALNSKEVTSKLVWDCKEELRVLADRNHVKLIWVPGHQGVAGNEKADELARKGSENPPNQGQTLGVPKCTVRAAVRDWIGDKHKNYWETIPGNKHGKEYIKGPCHKRTADLLAMNRSQLRTVTGLLTGHAPVKEHLYKMGLYNGDLTCRLCGKDPETVTHILCCCEALDRKRQAIFGQPSGDPELYSSHPVKNLYKLVQGTKVLEWVL